MKNSLLVILFCAWSLVCVRADNPCIPEQYPTVSCPGDSTLNTDPGTCSASSPFSATANDDCGPLTADCSPDGPFVLGDTLVTCTANNQVGSSYCSFTVTVIDAEAPVIGCNGMDLGWVTNPGVCEGNANYSPPAATDNCGPVNVTCDPPPGALLPKGVHTITCIAVDGAGNSSSCSFNFYIYDGEPPTITCPGNLSVPTAPAGACSAAVTFSASPADNCPDPTYTCTPASGATFPKGTTTVSCTPTDSSGNVGSACSFTVTVVDTEKPNITCPADTITCSGSAGNAVVSWAEPTVSDNCPGVSASCTPASGSTFNIGATTVTCTATDSSGNTRACSFTVTVVQLTSQCVATIPSDRTRTTVGVGEQVSLQVSGAPGTVTWSVSGGGTLSPTTGMSTTLTSPDTASTTVVTVSFNGGSCNKTFTVIVPSGVLLTKSSGDKHLKNWTSAGFLANIKILPTTVSFYAIQVKEDSVAPTGTSGAWAGIGNHTEGPWLTVNMDNTLPAQDHISSKGGPGAVPGG